MLSGSRFLVMKLTVAQARAPSSAPSSIMIWVLSGERSYVSFKKLLTSFSKLSAFEGCVVLIT